MIFFWGETKICLNSDCSDIVQERTKIVNLFNMIPENLQNLLMTSSANINLHHKNKLELFQYLNKYMTPQKVNL